MENITNFINNPFNEPPIDLSANKCNNIYSIIEEFKLPITFIDPQLLHPLSSIVATDLELYNTLDNSANDLRPIDSNEPNKTTSPIDETITPSNDTSLTSSPLSPFSQSMYSHLFKPTHIFGKQMITQWVKQYTTNIPYLKDTQQVIQNSKQYLENMNGSVNGSDNGSVNSPTADEKTSIEPYKVDCNKLLEIWDNVKNDDSFLEKYNYMDWAMLKYLNNSSSFLQSTSLINIISPLLNLLIPIIFLVFPFVLLKFQGVPITFTKYLDVLKEISKAHFIGKTILSMENLTYDKIGYLIIGTAFYFIQIYQNANSCYRYYRNIRKMNDALIFMRDYLKYSIKSMETFNSVNYGVSSYFVFCSQINGHIMTLKTFLGELDGIDPFNISLDKFNNMGNMLKCFYDLHSNPEYNKSLRFSMGFEGYINNILGVYENIIEKNIAIAEFNIEKTTKFTKQYYPSHKTVAGLCKNSCDLNKNMIITGVNASGKTTILKTTTINIIFTQQFGYGYYKSCSMNPYTHIHSYLNIPDTSGRDSLFQSESRRCKEILDIIRENPAEKYNRHFCIFDELYSGTNPTDATKSAYAFLLFLTKYKNVDFMLTTHYTALCKKLKTNPKIANYKMLVDIREDGSFDYKYQIKRGVSKIHGAVEILKKLDYPSEIIENVSIAL